MEVIPLGKGNIYKASFGGATHLPNGFKYTQQNGGTKYTAYFYGINPNAPAGSNAASGWTVRIPVGNKWLTTNGNLVRNAAAHANDTHIPLMHNMREVRR